MKDISSSQLCAGVTTTVVQCDTKQFPQQCDHRFSYTIIVTLGGALTPHNELLVLSILCASLVNQSKH